MDKQINARISSALKKGDSVGKCNEIYTEKFEVLLTQQDIDHIMKLIKKDDEEVN